jgi:predicted small integral membrane protein
MMVPGSHIGHQKMVLIRCSKILLVASVALFTTLVVFNNITDYGSNYAFVEHVLRMDTTFPNNKGMWRAITSPTLHHAAYMLIILMDALLCWAGAVKLLGALRKEVIEFNRSKNVAIAGLTLGFCLWFMGFIGIAGEWFLMWQSPQWNAQQAAFRLTTIFGIVLLFVTMPDTDPFRLVPAHFKYWRKEG